MWGRERKNREIYKQRGRKLDNGGGVDSAIRFLHGWVVKALLCGGKKAHYGLVARLRRDTTHGKETLATISAR